MTRTRLQVFIPTATATALGVAAEAMGLSRAQTVDWILTKYLLWEGILTKAEWPKPNPPAATQRPITLPVHLVEWLQSQPGTMSDAVRHAIARGMDIEKRGGQIYRPKPQWMTDRRRVNVRVPPEMVAVIKARQAQHGLSWSAVATTYIVTAWYEADRKP